MRRACGLEVISHCYREEHAICPLRHRTRSALQTFGIESFLGADVLQHIANQHRVANDLIANLQNRNAPIAARERLHIGFGHHHRLEDRFPREIFVAKNGANLLSEGGTGIVMEEDVLVHDVSPRLFCLDG